MTLVRRRTVHRPIGSWTFGRVERPASILRRSNVIRLAGVVVAAVLGVFVVVFRSSLLPARFGFDADLIQRIAAGRPHGVTDAAFANVGTVYRVAGLAHEPLAAGLLGYLLSLAVLAIALQRIRWQPNWLCAAALVVAILLSSVYLGTYSKDVLLLPVIAVLLAVPRGLGGEVAIVVTMLAYAGGFRGYWFLVALLYLGFRGVLLVTKRRWMLLIAAPAVLVALALLIPAATGHPSDYWRTLVNGARSSVDASTSIHDFVRLPAPLDSIVNTELVLGTIVLPVPLLVLGAPYYMLAAAMIVLLWTAFICGAVRVPTTSIAARGVVLVIAFVTTQAIFEPDYGSMLRHLTPLLGIFCLVAAARRRQELSVFAAAKLPSPPTRDRGQRRSSSDIVS